MKNFRISKFAVAILSLLLAACVSNYAPYTEKDLVEVPQYEGKWTYPNQKGGPEENRWLLEKLTEKRYRLVYINRKIRDTYLARFFKLNDQLFVDLQVTDSEMKQNSDEHVIGKITGDSTALNVAFIRTEYLVKLAVEKKIDLKFETHTDRSSDYNTGTQHSLAEPTDKLQQLLIKYKDDKNVFPAFDLSFVRIQAK